MKIPHDCVPRIDAKSIRKRIAAHAVAAVLRASQGEAADQRRDRGVPEHGQVLAHQRDAGQEGVQRRADSWRDKGVAVRQADGADLPHRLPWRRLPFRRLRHVDCPEERRAGREDRSPRAVYSRDP